MKYYKVDTMFGAMDDDTIYIINTVNGEFIRANRKDNAGQVEILLNAQTVSQTVFELKIPKKLTAQSYLNLALYMGDAGFANDRRL